MWWFLISTAFPCGGLAEVQGEFADTTGTQVLFQQTADGFAATYATQFSGEVAELGWVIPVYGAVSGVSDADSTIFQRLSDATAPQAYYESASGGGGCLLPTKSDAGALNDVRGQGVDVVASGFTGTYEWFALDAADPGALDAWLTEHSFVMNDARGPIQHYIDDGWQFVALRVVAPDDSSVAREARPLPPVTIAYGGEASGMRWPAVMMSSSNAAEQRITLYVEADHEALIGAGAAAEDVGNLDVDAEMAPEDAYLARLRALGGAGKYGVTYVGMDVQGLTGRVTRFDAAVAPSFHTADIDLTVSGDSDRWLRTEIYIDGPPPEEAAWLALAPLLGWALRRRGDRRGA